MLRARPVLLAAITAGTLCAPLATTTRSNAQSSSEIAVAKDRFRDGLKLESASDWKGALDQFRRAASIKRTPQIDFHLGLCEARSGDLVAAIIDLERAVTSAREKGANDVESAASSELADARARTPTLEIDAPADRVQHVVVDGATIASATLSSPVPMNPGDHTIAIEFANGRVEKRVTLAERDVKKVAIDPPSGIAATPTQPQSQPQSPTQTQTQTQPQTPSQSPTQTSPSPSRTVPWLLVGGGGALIVGGAVFFALRQGELSTLNSSCPSGHACDPSLQSNYDAGKTDTTIAFVLGGAGIAAAAVGASLLLFGGGSSREASASIVPAPGGASIVGRF